MNTFCFSSMQTALLVSMREIFTYRGGIGRRPPRRVEIRRVDQRQVEIGIESAHGGRYLSNSLVLVHSCVPLLMTIKKSCVRTKGTRSRLYPNFFFLWSRKWPKSMWKSCGASIQRRTLVRSMSGRFERCHVEFYLSIIFNHDVAIVSIPYPQDKCGDTIACA